MAPTTRRDDPHRARRLLAGAVRHPRRGSPRCGAPQPAGLEASADGRFIRALISVPADGTMRSTNHFSLRCRPWNGGASPSASLPARGAKPAIWRSAGVSAGPRSWPLSWRNRAACWRGDRVRARAITPLDGGSMRMSVGSAPPAWSPAPMTSPPRNNSRRPGSRGPGSADGKRHRQLAHGDRARDAPTGGDRPGRPTSPLPNAAPWDIF